MSTPTRPEPVMAVVFGGASTEHEASLHTAATVLPALVRLGITAAPVFVTQTGQWCLLEGGEGDCGVWAGLARASELSVPCAVELTSGRMRLIRVVPTDTGTRHRDAVDIDSVMSLLHGGAGEDGSMSGLCAIFGIPFHGPSTLTAAVTLDKSICRAVLQAHGIPMTRAVEVGPDPSTWTRAESLALPLVVKPVGQGSSVGVSYVPSRSGLAAAMGVALAYGQRALIEEYVDAIELHCYTFPTAGGVAISAVSGSQPRTRVHTYQQKVEGADSHEVRRFIQDDLPSEAVRITQDLAAVIADALRITWLARLDFFLADDGRIWFAEANSVPANLGPVTGRNPWVGRFSDYDATLAALLGKSHPNTRTFTTSTG